MKIVNINKDKLKELYIEKKLSSIVCGVFFDCCPETIIKRLRQYNIPVRKIGETRKGLIGWWKGKHHTEETKRKLREIGEKRKCLVAGWNKGKYQTEETKEKRSKVLKKMWQNPEFIKKRYEAAKKMWQNPIYREHRRESFKGEKSHFWKGGITPLNYLIRRTDEYNEWRNNIYRSNKYICQICGKHCGREDIIAHHIKCFADYPELRFDINNGITLCRNCHAKIHKKDNHFYSKGELLVCL